ncbi:hypothetical protein [Anatilimnocola floriformis]|uniref:hypothetical protein n=1 Tax=Anatilimnocola floriformis TaxID=2948575 RepID=UPI0020C30CBF|nr:hypothetical protein [Anatilimnocola floriformis]
MTNYQRAKELASFGAELCTEAKSLLNGINSFLATNTTFSIDWAAETLPDNLQESNDGNLDGLHFSRTDLANAIYSLNQIKALLLGESVSQGNYFGNVLKLAQVEA